MPAPQVHSRALKRAVEIAGGPAALAREIGVPRAVLELYLAGQDETPPEVFLRVVDIIVDYDIEALRNAHGRKEA